MSRKPEPASDCSTAAGQLHGAPPDLASMAWQSESPGRSCRAIEWPPEYDPINLKELRQPRPNDVPAHLDSSIFTFDDAFEDLLSSHIDGHVQDIRALYGQRLLLRYIYPDGEPPLMQRLRHAMRGCQWNVQRDNTRSHWEEMRASPILGTEFGQDAWSVLTTLMGIATEDIRHPRVEHVPSLYRDKIVNAKYEDSTQGEDPCDETELADRLQSYRDSWPSPFEALKAGFSADAWSRDPTHSLSEQGWSENYSTVSRSTFTSRTDSDGYVHETTRKSHRAPDGRDMITTSKRTVSPEGKTVRYDEQVYEDKTGWALAIDESAHTRGRQEGRSENSGRTSWFWKR